ncbi:hypothetical protein VHEMI06391 [[Torrubiella] hemipterigena]|uniref:Amidase domain-containing protein n=1 Tax=[Torrubiella] hemipterigena TaxID=1531966 RepID=A0A0A1TJB1_9HYPO|nr:hypothetical protein VHEMI06391 [[Torrubiella] hemipterigena]
MLAPIAAALVALVCPVHHFSFCNSEIPPLVDATLDELRSGLANGRFTSVDLVTAYIHRINEVNDRLHAVNEINPDALSIAAQLDLARRSGKSDIGPLHGIPILIKDSIATADKLNTTAGSLALLGSTVAEDSTVVAKLRKAGAIILGKSNLSQWSGIRGSNSTDGWSAYGGQTQGAYFEGMDPAGSSSGSAVAASIGLSWATLGIDTDGSLINPAHKNNIVGIRPTVGLTSRHLVVPVSEHLDTVGPMARTVKDAAYLLQAIAGADRNDKFTSASPYGYNSPDYVAACRTSGLQGKRIGVPKGMQRMWFDKSTIPAFAALSDVLQVLRDAGAEIVEDIELPGVRDLMKEDKTFRELMHGDFVASLPKYLDQLKTNPNHITSAPDLLEFTQHTEHEEYPYHNTESWSNAIEHGDKVSTAWQEAFNRQRHLSGKLGLTGALANHSLDALIMPTFLASKIAYPNGCPVISVPLGKAPAWTPTITNSLHTLNLTSPNQPIGLAFAGSHWSEESLISMAYAFEQRTLRRQQVTPYLAPTIEIKDVQRGAGDQINEL